MNIQEYYNTERSRILAIYLTGSRTYPCITKNIRDTDFIIVCKSNDDAKRLCFESNKADFRIDGSTKNGRYYCSHLPYNPMNISYFSTHYLQLLAGKELRQKDDFFDHTEEYKDCLRITLPPFIRMKQAYYILMGAYILKNYSYEFTKEQSDEIQNAHDMNISQKSIQFLREFLDANI